MGGGGASAIQWREMKDNVVSSVLLMADVFFVSQWIFRNMDMAQFQSDCILRGFRAQASGTLSLGRGMPPPPPPPNELHVLSTASASQLCRPPGRGGSRSVKTSRCVCVRIYIYI